MPDPAGGRARSGRARSTSSRSRARRRHENFVDARRVAPGKLDLVPPVVCIGPSTAEAARPSGFDVAAVAEPHDTEGLIEAVLAVATASR